MLGGKQNIRSVGGPVECVGGASRILGMLRSRWSVCGGKQNIRCWGAGGVCVGGQAEY